MSSVKSRRARVKGTELYVSGEFFSEKLEPKVCYGPTGGAYSIPLANRSFVDAVLAQPCALPGLKIGEILAFINNAGENWKKPDYVQRTRYERMLRHYLGYSPEAARNEANWIALLLCSTHRLYDLLASELGDWAMVDGWVNREEAMVTAAPRGRVLHILPGNVPLSAVVSLLRAIITKNYSILKVSSSDPFTASSLLASFIEIDPNHPVTRSISIAYWEPGTDGLAEVVAGSVDAVVAWGGNEAVEWARQNGSSNAEIIAFGPKRSVTIIGHGADVDRVAAGAAFDAAIYDQRACFSTREIFVHTSCAAKFAASFAEAQAKIDRVLPASSIAFDDQANRSLCRLHDQFMGAKVDANHGEGCTVLNAPREGRLQHCLGRTVYVTPFDDFAEVLPEIDSTIQTAGVAPREFAETVRDQLSSAGVSRIVEPGLHNVFRPGGSHDGMFPLQRLVRFVSHEAPSDILSKGINVRIDQTEFIEHNRFLEFIP